MYTPNLFNIELKHSGSEGLMMAMMMLMMMMMMMMMASSTNA
jgi:hypothetical protein